MARRKHVTVAILINGVETKHRGATLKQALKVAEEARFPRNLFGRKKNCHVEWRSRVKGGNVVKRNAASNLLLDGSLMCEVEPVYGIVYRDRPRLQRRLAWMKQMHAKTGRMPLHGYSKRRR